MNAKSGSQQYPVQIASTVDEHSVKISEVEKERDFSPALSPNTGRWNFVSPPLPGIVYWDKTPPVGTALNAIKPFDVSESQT